MTTQINQFITWRIYRIAGISYLLSGKFVYSKQLLYFWNNLQIN